MSKPNNDRFRPTTDDRALEETEAHAARIKGTRQDDETEGHMPLREAASSADDDTEGHAIKARG